MNMVRNTIILICGIIIIITLITFFMEKNDSTQINKPSDQSGTIVKGSISSIDRSCTYDAPTCSIRLDDDSKIIFAYADGNQPPQDNPVLPTNQSAPKQMGKIVSSMNILATDNAILIGKKIEAFVAPVPEMNKVYTILGNTEFYIRIVD